MNYTSYIKININNLNYNINYLKNNLPYKYYWMDISNNAFNHGMYLSRFLNDINFLSVNNLNDVIKLRKYNKKITLIYEGEITLDNIYDLILQNVIFVIKDIETLKMFNSNEKLKFIIKIDPNNYDGINSKTEILDIIDFGKEHNYKILGIIGNILEKDYDEFKYIISPLKDLEIICLNNEFDKKKIKLSNTIKLNYSIYGFNDLKKGKYQKEKYPLKQIFNLNTKIIKIKKEKIKKKENIIGIIPLGYLNGINLNIDNVIINNKLYKVTKIFENISLILIDDNVKINDLVEITSNNNPLEKYFPLNPINKLYFLGYNLPILYEDKNNAEIFVC